MKTILTLVPLAGLCASAVSTASALAVGSGCPEYAAQSAGQITGRITGRITGQVAGRPASQTSRSVVTMSTNDGSDSYEVRITDGKIVAKRNGQVIPEDRVRRGADGDAEVIEILDENGAVLSTFNLLQTPTAPAAPMSKIRIERDAAHAKAPKAPKAVRGFRTDRDDNGNPAIAAVAGDAQPPVMVGVTMSEPEDSVLEFLKLEKAVVFDRVIDGLPAANAGIRAGDILVELQGEKNIDQDQLRKVLRNAKPGDTIKVKIARAGGEMMDKELALVAFDSKALGIEDEQGLMDMETGGPGNLMEIRAFGDAHNRWDTAQKALEQAMQEIKNNASIDAATQETIRESLTKAMESMKDAKQSMRDVQIFTPDMKNMEQWNAVAPKLRNAPGQNRLMLVPGAPGMPGHDNDRVKSLEKKVDELSAKLDELTALLKERR